MHTKISAGCYIHNCIHNFIETRNCTFTSPTENRTRVSLLKLVNIFIEKVLQVQIDASINILCSRITLQTSDQHFFLLIRGYRQNSLTL